MPVPTGQSVDLLFAEIEATADGDNEIVAGSDRRAIRVIGYCLTGTDVGILRFKLSASRTVPLKSGADGGGASYAGNLACPAFETDYGEPLIVVNPAGVDSYGHVTYYLED